MQLAQRAATKREKYDFFIHAFPGGGKSGFILDSYWEKDGKRGGPVVFDFDQGGIMPTADDMHLGGKVPIFSLTTEDEIIYSCTYLDDIISQVHDMPEFKDYQVDLIAYDTLSSMEEMLMGETRRAHKPDLPASPGSGILATGRKRDPDDPLAPALQDYKAINIRTKAFIRRVRDLPINTIITCHTDGGDEELTESRKALAGDTTVEELPNWILQDALSKSFYQLHLHGDLSVRTVLAITLCNLRSVDADTVDTLGLKSRRQKISNVHCQITHSYSPSLLV